MAVLVAYASSRGSTQGIAERLAARLYERGMAAEAQPVTKQPGGAAYDAVILGSAVHGGSWLPEARDFAFRNAALLRQRPVWLFSVSTLGDQESMFPPGVAKKLRAMRRDTQEVATLRAELHPREHRNFAGAVERSDWPVSGRAFFRAMGGQYGDSRNWPAVDAWADSIADALTASPPAHQPERVE